ncbi:MAG TPA: ABC transporter permease [Polyangia bacterium]
MDALWKDVRFALRMLRRTPGVTAAAVIALALGIGANTAIFSVVDGVLLRPLPYRDSRALVVLNGQFPVQSLFHIPISVPEFLDLQQQSRTLASIGAYTAGDSNLSGGSGAPERVCAGAASASFFPTLGVQPALGRNFTVDEQLVGHNHVALIDDGLWRQRFGADAGIVGKKLLLDGEAFQIIGVLPRGFQIDGPCEVWAPLLSNDPRLTRGSHFLRVIGRVAGGTTRGALDADLAAIGARLIEQYPKNYRGGSWSLEEKPLLDDVVGDARPALLMLLAAVAFVLLIACANVANLMLARAAARSREMAVRTALGAARGRLVRQMLTEALILSLFGGALGLLLAVWGVDGMVALSPDALPRAAEIALDSRVLAFTMGLSLVTGVVFGLAPALSASRPDLTWALKDGARGATSARGRLRDALVVAELALSLMLLVGTGLMARSFVQLRRVDPGFRPDHVLTMSASLPSVTRDDDEKARWVAFFARASERLAQLPGVRAAGAATLLPLDNNSQDYSFEIENYVPRVPGDQPDNQAREVEGDYFGALGIPLVRGRMLAPSDDLHAPRVVVINQAMAKRYWPNDEALGKRIRVNMSGRTSAGELSTVVGIVGDVHGFGLDQPAKAEMYFPHAQMRSASSMSLVIRTAGEPLDLAPSARAALAEIDPQQPLFNVRTMNDLVAQSLAQRRFSLLLMLIFAGVALLLAAVGIYGVMSYTVAQRTQEIGIRMALGATPASVLSMVVGDGMRLVAGGLALGLAGAFAVTRLVASMLYGVSASDVVTYAVLAVALGGVALVAILIPARRATRVEPMLALRAD